MKKWWLCLMCLLLLAACGKKDAGNPSTDVTTQQEAAQETAGENAQEAGQTEDEAIEGEVEEIDSVPAQKAASYIRSFYAADPKACAELLSTHAKKAFLTDFKASMAENNVPDEQIKEYGYDLSIDPADEEAFASFMETFMKGMEGTAIGTVRVKEENTYALDSEEASLIFEKYYVESPHDIQSLCEVFLECSFFSNGKPTTETTQVFCVEENGEWSLLSYGF